MIKKLYSLLLVVVVTLCSLWPTKLTVSSESSNFTITLGKPTETTSGEYKVLQFKDAKIVSNAQGIVYCQPKLTQIPRQDVRASLEHLRRQRKFTDAGVFLCYNICIGVRRYTLLFQREKIPTFISRGLTISS